MVFRKFLNGAICWSSVESWEREKAAAVVKRESASPEDKARDIQRKLKRRHANPKVAARELERQQARRQSDPERYREHQVAGALRRKKLRRDDAEWRELENAKKRTPAARCKQAAYVRERCARDPVYRAARRLRTRLRKVFRQRSIPKTGPMLEMLGCSWAQLQTYFETIFQPGMTWENMALWDIDHKIPLASAATPEEIATLSHFTNLQPLWRVDNMQKGASMHDKGIIRMDQLQRSR